MDLEAYVSLLPTAVLPNEVNTICECLHRKCLYAQASICREWLHLVNAGSYLSCRALDQQQPRETMEQHLLAYLTTKYGIRQLITQWLGCILAAIEHFSSLSAQVALFGKVLRNEVEEEFEEAQQKVMATARNLLKEVLQVSLTQSWLIHFVQLNGAFIGSSAQKSRLYLPLQSCKCLRCFVVNVLHSHAQRSHT